MKCRSCDSHNLKLIIDLGMHGWCNNFITKDQIGTEKSYPLRLYLCLECGLAQIDYTVPKETMFIDHTYVSGTNKTLREHFGHLVEENIKQFSLTKNSSVLDIGGNDGTQLLEYKKRGIENLINVESASNIAKLSKDAGICTISEFFNEETIQKYDIKDVDLVNASGVFFHLEELHSVTRAIEKILSQNGVFVVQCMYFGDMLRSGAFDGIYHEHLCYYSLYSLSDLLERHGLRIFDAYHSDIHGGSLIAKVCRTNSSRFRTNRYNITADTDIELVNYNTITNGFADKIIKFKQQLNKVVGDKKIYGLGAPAKGNTLLTYCGLDCSKVIALLEVNKLKVGLYSPVTHIPVVEEDLDSLPDRSVILVLSWNFWGEIREKLLNIATRKNFIFIIPWPQLKVIQL